MPGDDTSDGLTYGERLRRKGIHTRTSGWTYATRDQVQEGRTKDGERFKTVTDQLGNRVTERTDARGRQRQDVHINLS